MRYTENIAKFIEHSKKFSSNLQVEKRRKTEQIENE